MTIDHLKKLVREIVEDASRLCSARTSEGSAPVNYACVFTHSETEYEALVNLARQLGPVVQETAIPY